MVDTDIDEQTFALINLYNTNTETEQIKTICELCQLLGDFCLDSKKYIILTEDFSLFSDPSLEASVSKPALKKKSISKLVQIFNKTTWLMFREFAIQF